MKTPFQNFENEKKITPFIAPLSPKWKKKLFQINIEKNGPIAGPKMESCSRQCTVCPDAKILPQKFGRGIFFLLEGFLGEWIDFLRNWLGTLAKRKSSFLENVRFLNLLSL